MSLLSDTNSVRKELKNLTNAGYLIKNVSKKKYFILNIIILYLKPFGKL